MASDSPASLADFDAWALRTVLNPQLPLFREARYLLAEETDIRDTAIYHAVLGAIASGNSSRGGSSSYIGRKSPDIGHPLAVLEDSQLIARETVHSGREGRCTGQRTADRLLSGRDAAGWTRLERGDTVGAWRNSQATFLAQVVGPHFKAICRDWALSSGKDMFGSVPGEVPASVVADPIRRGQIQVDVAVFAPDDPGQRAGCSLLAKQMDKVMSLGHIERLRRARDLLAVKGYDTARTRLTCYSGTGFEPELRDLAAADPVVQLIGLERVCD